MIPAMTGRPAPGCGMTISDQLGRHARTHPSAPALRFDGQTRTYRELDERVNRLSRVLLERGAQQGDRVAMLCLNSVEQIEMYFACARIGTIAVPLNFRSTRYELAYLLADSGAEYAIVDADFLSVFTAALEGRTLRTVLVIGTADPAEPAISYNTALAAVDGSEIVTQIDEYSAFVIMYTSGTTGRPKGAMLSHNNLTVQVQSRIAHLGMPVSCRTWLIATPLFHVAAFSGMLPAFALGGTVVLAPNGAFNPDSIVDLFESERVNACFLVPSQWEAICRVPGLADRDLSQLQTISWGAAPATTVLLRNLIDAFPTASIYTAFGQSELSPVTTILLGEDAERKLGSIGTPLLNVETRIVDAEMNDVAVGEIGEIVYRGPTVMIGYWNKPEATAEAFHGGWFHSGDLVRQDDEGYLYVVDRLKDMIISGGENIYCAEVEDVLASHPAIAEVALIGSPDDRWGEVPHAVIAVIEGAPEPTDAEVEAWCRARLATFKCPKAVTVVAALPRNTTGKVQKTQLRTLVSAV